jgi:hypothetical protein
MTDIKETAEQAASFDYRSSREDFFLSNFPAKTRGVASGNMGDIGAVVTVSYGRQQHKKREKNILLCLV